MTNAPKKFAPRGEYVITQAQSNSISVLRQYNNVIGSLRQIAEQVGFAYDEKWNTRTFGAKFIDHLS